jgi:hypothetical protein
MELNMNPFCKALLVAASTLALSAATASAEIACNGEGECWHVKRHDFHPDLKLTVHPDNWKWAAHEKYKWREHGRARLLAQRRLDRHQVA